MSPRPLLAGLACALAAGAGAPGARAAVDDLPTPAAMALGQRLIPGDLVRGFEDGVAAEVLDAVLGARVPAARAPAVRARARAAMAPALDEAFPTELVAGWCAEFVARHYRPDEIRDLAAWEASPLGQKVRAFDAQARGITAADPAEAERAREQLARRTFTEDERKAVAAFAASPAAAKGRALAPDLAAHVLEELDRRYAAVRPALQPRLVSAVEAVLATEPKGEGR